jgi:hypothetical protein
MPTIDSYRKQAKQLVRWHRERNYSIGGKFRLLERYRNLTDIEALNTPLPLTVAQEIVAVEAGYENWAALRASAPSIKQTSPSIEREPTLLSAVPILFVRDVRKAAAFYADKLAFQVDFLHGIHLSMVPSRAINRAFICGSCTSRTFQSWLHAKGR